MQLTVATLLWSPNNNSEIFSRMYDESWVEKLYRGFKRNLTVDFEFVCYVDELRMFNEPIVQKRISSQNPSYSDCIQPFELNAPMILTGLDTVVTGNIDHLAKYCHTSNIMALPRDPYRPERACTGVVLVPGGKKEIFKSWKGENDMEHMRAQPHVFIDDLFPDHVVSYKGHTKDNGLGDSRIVYFHGKEKPHELSGIKWIQDNWK